MEGIDLKILRKSHRLTQEQLAHKLGVAFGTVNMWENGKTRPSPMAVRLINLLFKQGHPVKRPLNLRIAPKCEVLPIASRPLDGPFTTPDERYGAILRLKTSKGMIDALQSKYPKLQILYEVEQCAVWERQQENREFKDTVSVFRIWVAKRVKRKVDGDP